MGNQAEEILKKSKTIAVVGLSEDRSRPSHQVSKYMQAHGYRIIPVNPNAKNVLGEAAYSTLSQIPESIRIDIVDIFRRSDYVAEVVDQAIRRGVGCIWMQLGVSDELAGEKASKAGIPVFQNSCIAVAHQKLLGKPNASASSSS